MIEYNPRAFKMLLIATIVLSTPVLLFIDSPYFASHVFDGRIVSDFFILIAYVLFLMLADKKVFKLLLIMPFVGLFFEILGSQIVVLYDYRLAHVPIYVPFGHAILYGVIYEISKLDYIWSNHKALESFLNKFCFTICFTSLLINNDVFGFLAYLLFLVLISNRQKPIFYLLLFVYTFMMELCGTTMCTWTYYGVLGNHPSWPSIGLVPAGMAGLYMALDISANSIYYYLAHYRHTKVMLNTRYRISQTAPLGE
jgi:hypothetical protein